MKRRLKWLKYILKQLRKEAPISVDGAIKKHKLIVKVRHRVFMYENELWINKYCSTLYDD